ncbi:Uncharacterised protein [Paenibacillus macerans]|nr:hypothetical protein PbDSM24746_27810 [Paenibacillus macerans]GBK69090.1 hypothetical protein PbJCM17693_27980 [Paenibacillus macerans]GIP11160.1 hypothetical protein J1TS5_33300 [Paenibacillus macerans]SUD26946.1 Uncharacterised protein [Paenibacillus macerans]
MQGSMQGYLDTNAIDNHRYQIKGCCSDLRIEESVNSILNDKDLNEDLGVSVNVSEITGMRCDGVVECIYEYKPTMVIINTLVLYSFSIFGHWVGKGIREISRKR